MSVFAWTAKLVTEALGQPAASWDHAYTGISTDTRSLKQNELFVALKGDQFDAHDYLGDARLAGVGGVIVRTGTPRWPGFDWFEVDDTLDALGRLAALRRRKFAGPVVAITGTMGKTSTKELAAAVFAPLGDVHRTEQNLNNLIGVPLTVLAAPLEAKVMVVECGASVRGEISRMRDIVRPDVAVVTAVDAGHLEGFGSMDAVLEEKASLTAGAKTAVVGTHPPALAEAVRQLAKATVVAGFGEGAQWTADDVELDANGGARFAVRGARVALSIPGRHMVGNALIALAVADALGVKLAEACEGLARATLPGGRSEVTRMHGVTLINDCYNANPASLRAALDLMNAVRSGRGVAVVGTMLELGADSDALHRASADDVLAAKPDLVVAIGAFAPIFERLKDRIGKKKLITGATPAAVAERLKQKLTPGDTVLLKASHGVKLETIIPLLWPEAHA